MTAIYLNILYCNENSKLVDRRPRYVAIRIGKYTLYSCSSSKPIEDFEIYLQGLSNSLNQFGRAYTIVAGDLNAKHGLWGARSMDAREKILAEWVAQRSFVVLNEGVPSTCSRSTGESFIDVTFCTEDLGNTVTGWKVHENSETLSDHRYITMSRKGRLG